MDACIRSNHYRLTHITDWREQLDGATCNTDEDELQAPDPSTWLSDLFITGWEARAVAHRRWTASPDQPEYEIE